LSAPRSRIVNSPYERPAFPWQQGAGTALYLVHGRRPASHELIDARNNSRRVEAWRATDYLRVTSVTRDVPAHWLDARARSLPFHFCEIEAIATLSIEELP